MLAGQAVPVTLVTPQAWKKAMGVSADKGTSLRRAVQLFRSVTARVASQVWWKRVVA